MKSGSFLMFIVIISFLSVSAQSQQYGLYMPLEFQKAYQKGTRKPDGSVSPLYWQDRSVYKLKAKVDPYKKLLQYNDLDNVDILQQSMLIYLEKKQKHGSRDYHIVSANENIYDIAQEEGVQLESLLVYNNLQKSTQPKAGDKILLRGENKKQF